MDLKLGKILADILDFIKDLITMVAGVVVISAVIMFAIWGIFKLIEIWF